MTLCLVNTHLHLFGAIAFIAGPNIIALALHPTILAARTDWQQRYQHTIKPDTLPTAVWYVVQLVYAAAILRLAYIIRYPYRDAFDGRHQHPAGSLLGRPPLPERLDDLRTGNCRLATDDPQLFDAAACLMRQSPTSLSLRRLMYQHPYHAQHNWHVRLRDIPPKKIQAAVAALIEHRQSSQSLDPLRDAAPRYQRLHLQAVCVFFAQWLVCSVWRDQCLEGLPQSLVGMRSWSLGEALMPGAWTTLLAGGGLIAYLLLIDAEQDRLFQKPPPMSILRQPVLAVLHLHLALVTLYGLNVALVFEGLLLQLRWMRYVIFVVNLGYLMYAAKETVPMGFWYSLVWVPFAWWQLFTLLFAFDTSMRIDS